MAILKLNDVSQKPTKTDKPFLRYFLQSYIPPYIKPMPQKLEDYEAHHLRAHEIWWHLYQILERMPITYKAKRDFEELFEYTEKIWWIHISEQYTYAQLRGLPEVNEYWRKAQHYARELYVYGERNGYYAESGIIVG